MQILSYLFWPNPPAPTYESPKVIALLVVCGLMVVLGLLVRLWRKKMQNPMTRKLSASWPTALLWFGFVGLFLVVCRVEGISFLSMRVLWFVWAATLLFYVGLQFKLFKMRHYEVLPNAPHHDPRDPYLPRRKKH